MANGVAWPVSISIQNSHARNQFQTIGQWSRTMTNGKSKCVCVCVLVGGVHLMHVTHPQLIIKNSRDEYMRLRVLYAAIRTGTLMLSNLICLKLVNIRLYSSATLSPMGLVYSRW